MNGGPASASARGLIVNADDFGLTAKVNAGIVAAHRGGVVRSASLMTSTPGFEDAVRLARENPALDLGIHLALTGVRPVLPPAENRSLLDGRGRFRPLWSLLPRLVAGRVEPVDIERELGAQVERALSTGLLFSHLDGHHHVHLFGPLPGIVADLAREFGIPFVRRVRRVNWLAGRTEPAFVAVLAKRALLRGADRRAGRAFQGMRAVDAFRGLPFPITLAAWRVLIDGLPPGTTEFMCHPGLIDPAVAEFDRLIVEREVERDWLCRPELAALLDSAGVTLTSFRELLDTNATTRAG